MTNSSFVGAGLRRLDELDRAGDMPVCRSALVGAFLLVAGRLVRAGGRVEVDERDPYLCPGEPWVLQTLVEGLACVDQEAGLVVDVEGVFVQLRGCVGGPLARLACGGHLAALQ